jgi:acetylornithine deacetylase/succinyl-diaminopimelate desuccinylase-like protein
MRKCPTFVIPSAARDLVFSATYEEEISRLHLEMTVATQSPRRKDAKVGFVIIPTGEKNLLEIPRFHSG